MTFRYINNVSKILIYLQDFCLYFRHESRSNSIATSSLSSNFNGVMVQEKDTDGECSKRYLKICKTK